jgi:hypothetical protein
MAGSIASSARPTNWKMLPMFYYREVRTAVDNIGARGRFIFLDLSMGISQARGSVSSADVRVSVRE